MFKFSRLVLSLFLINPIGASGTSADQIDPSQAHPHPTSPTASS